jgi:hypothetical protein
MSREVDATVACEWVWSCELVSGYSPDIHFGMARVSGLTASLARFARVR